jgi:hypothetical protein
VDLRRLALLLLVPLLPGCNACWIVQPADPIGLVTVYAVKFHRYYEPGSFVALLDGENVTAQFAPAPAQSGTATMVRNQPFGPGDPFINPAYVNQGDVVNVATKRLHEFSVSCKCVEGALCGHGDAINFFPLNYAPSPSQVNIPAGGAAQNMTLIADRPLTAPVPVTITPHLLGGAPGPANHIRVNGAAPGAATTVTLSPGGAPTIFYVQSVSPGGFWLGFETPGAQRTAVTGIAH